MPGTHNSGRRPTKTIAQHRLRGSFRRDRHGDPDSIPALAPSQPAAPAWLATAAVPFFDAFAEVLHGAGVMADAFAPMLALLASTMAHYVALEGKLSADGFDARVWRQRNAMMDRVHKLLREFGLSPTALPMIQRLAEAKDDRDGKGRFFRPRLADTEGQP